MKEKTVITTQEATPAIGPYSQAILCGGFVFTSGQIPMMPDGSLVEGDIATQGRQAMENLTAVLQAAGCTMEHVVKATVFMAEMGEFAAFNEVYASYFADNPPARSCVGVKTLPKGVSVEVEAVAVKP